MKKKKKKIVAFLACGSSYEDEFAQIRGPFDMALRFYCAKDYEIHSNFITEGFDAYTSRVFSSLSLIDCLPEAVALFGDTEECDRVLMQGACAVVALCDADDPDQTDRLETVKALCATQEYHLRTLFFYSQDWSRFPPQRQKQPAACVRQAVGFLHSIDLF